MEIKIRKVLGRIVRWQTITVGKKQKKFPVPSLLGVVILSYIGYSLLRLGSYREWHVFTSEQHGYSIQYPGHWVMRGEYAPGIGRKNLNDLNVDFINGDALLFPTTIAVEIHHRTMPNGDLADVVAWGEEIIDITGGAIFVSRLDCDSIGIHEYSVLMRTYDRSTSSKVQDIYLISGDDAFILQLITSTGKWDGAMTIFEQMLASYRLPDSFVQLDEQRCQ